MNRTESDVRAVYQDPPGLEAAERRLIDSWRFAESGAPATTALGSIQKRRTRTVVGVSVVAAASVAAVAIAPQLSVDKPQRGAGSAPPTAATSATTSPRAKLPAVTKVTVTPQVTVQTLISLLPRKGSTTQLSGESDLGETGGQLIYDDGHGAAAMSVTLSYPYRYNGSVQRRPARSLCDSQGVRQLHTPCTTLADGSQLSVYRGNANIPGGATEWSVELLRADGVGVVVSEWNSSIEKGGSHTRREPPLTIRELTAVVRSGQWQPTVSPAVARGAAGLF